jgi:hypothetical protein
MISMSYSALGFSTVAVVMVSLPFPTEYYKGPAISADLGMYHKPEIGQSYLVCLEIGNRTKGGVELAYGGVPILGPGETAISPVLGVSMCSSVKAQTQQALLTKPVNNFDGSTVITIQQVDTPYASFSKGSAPRFTGQGSIYVGPFAGNHDVDGNHNVGVGPNALENLVSGGGNIGIGKDALKASTGSNNNIGIGSGALSQNLIGYNNTAVGTAALHHNLSAFDNTAIGIRALASTTTGSNNTAFGGDAFEENRTGERNTGLGVYAGRLSKTSSNNTVAGFGSLYHYEGTLGQNTAFGMNGLAALKGGGSNVAVGMNSGLAVREGVTSTWIGTESGAGALQKSDVKNATAIGAGSWTDANNQISVGNEEISQVRMWGYFTLMKHFPLDGAGVPVHSLFLGSDGALYFKSERGVSRLAQ